MTRFERRAAGACVRAALGLALLLPPAAAAAQDQPEPAAGAGTQTEETSPTLPRGALEALPEVPRQSGPIDPDRYRLGPGDVLSLEFTGRIARQVTIAVDAEGRANFPEVGAVRTAGRTLSDVRAQVLGRIRPAYPGARVELRLVTMRQFKVYVAGLVRTPGVTLADGGTRASELLHGPFALAEGASRRNLELRHADGTRERVDLDAFTALGRTADNPFVLDGDVLWVPPRTERIWALGAFGRPGEFEFAPHDSVAGLVALAGGLLPGADAAHAELVRFVDPTRVDSLPIDLTDPAGGAGNRPLQDGDRLFVHQPADFRHARNVTVVGEVALPGPYALAEGRDRVGDVLARAGGLTPNAARTRIQVFRPLVTDGKGRDIEFERLSRLSRSEMTDAEYEKFRTKLASQEATYVLSYSDLYDPANPHDVLLRDGDVILVDRQTSGVRVDGQVLRPSLVDYAPGRSVDQYLRLAGGPGRRAWLSHIRITHAGSNQTLYARDVREVEPGDFIWVPDKKEVSFWSTFKDVLAVAGAAATIVIVARGH